MKEVMASLKSGNWKALLACFLYFDTGFTVWVMFGPLAPFISKQLTLTPTQSAFLVAVPVLAASIVRVTLGNLSRSIGRCEYRHALPTFRTHVAHRRHGQVVK